MKKVVASVKASGFVTLFGFCALGLTACENQSTPRGALELAVQAVQHQDVRDLQRLFTESALEQYGTLSGAAELRTQLEALDLQPNTLTITPTGSARVRAGQNIRTFEARAEGTRGSVTVDISCLSRFEVYSTPTQTGPAKRRVTQCTIPQIRF